MCAFARMNRLLSQHRAEVSDTYGAVILIASTVSDSRKAIQHTQPFVN